MKCSSVILRPYCDLKSVPIVIFSMSEVLTFPGEVPGAGDLLPVLMQLPLPLIHVRGALLQRARQSQVVGLQSGQLDLPLLGVR